MATVLTDFTYFDRTFTKGDELDDDDPVIALVPQRFAPVKPKKKAAKPATPIKKERP